MYYYSLFCWNRSHFLFISIFQGAWEVKIKKKLLSLHLSFPSWFEWQALGTNSTDSFSIQIMKLKRKIMLKLELDGSPCALSNLGKLPSSGSSHVEACCYRLRVHWESLFDFFIWWFFSGKDTLLHWALKKKLTFIAAFGEKVKFLKYGFKNNKLSSLVLVTHSSQPLSSDFFAVVQYQLSVCPLVNCFLLFLSQLLCFFSEKENQRLSEAFRTNKPD